MTSPTNEPKTTAEILAGRIAGRFDREITDPSRAEYLRISIRETLELYAQQEGRELVEALGKPCTCQRSGYLSSHQYMCPQLKALASWKARNQ